MGGINHQPCREYLENSTKLSRQVSLTTVDLETANVHLEDVILQELGGFRCSLKPILDALNRAERNLQVALDICGDLRQQMQTSGYRDLPTLVTVDLDGLGKVLAEDGLVEPHAWGMMARTMKNGTFYANVRHFEDGFRVAISNIRTLRERFEVLDEDTRPLHQVAERNLSGNFKTAFAKAFTQWLRFHQEFLASSLVSTELYYASFGAPSLAKAEAPEHAAFSAA